MREEVELEEWICRGRPFLLTVFVIQTANFSGFLPSTCLVSYFPKFWKLWMYAQCLTQIQHEASSNPHLTLNRQLLGSTSQRHHDHNLLQTNLKPNNARLESEFDVWRTATTIFRLRTGVGHKSIEPACAARTTCLSPRSMCATAPSLCTTTPPSIRYSVSSCRGTSTPSPTWGYRTTNLTAGRTTSMSRCLSLPVNNSPSSLRGPRPGQCPHPRRDTRYQNIPTLPSDNKMGATGR